MPEIGWNSFLKSGDLAMGPESAGYSGFPAAVVIWEDLLHMALDVVDLLR